MVETSKDFKSVGLDKAMLDNLKSLGYLKMTPIQEKGLPFILSNRDFIGQANSGSGKTAAFALGILAKPDLTNRMPQALVLVPTRELAPAGDNRPTYDLGTFFAVNYRIAFNLDSV